MPQLKLSEQFRWYPIYEDTTRFGSAVTNQCDMSVRNACADIVAYRQAHGLAAVVNQTHALLKAAMSAGLAEFYDRPGVLHSDWLYPNPQSVRPVALVLEDERGQAIAQIPLAADLILDLAAYLGDWSQGAVPPTQPAALNLWNALMDLGAFAAVLPASPPLSGDVTFVGHSTVRIQSDTARILVDPFLLPKSSQYPANYQPLDLSELGHPDAVFITHSHPDHYDLASLFRLGADTAIYVPEVERESVLAINMTFRLRQLGFRQVKPLRWYEEAIVGDLRIVALPFYGEQPTVFQQLHPEVRNMGNTYLVEWGDRRIGLTADSGQDGQGDIKALAAEALERYGALDVLFGGFRGFALYPIQYLFSSVSRYLPFVPPSLWSVRQQMMCDANDLIDIAEIWQAQKIVPYSDGGAPWYWLRGLGPVLDSTSAASISAVDPTPQYLLDVAAGRSGTIQGGAIASPVAIELLNPGDSLVFSEEGMDVICPQNWPYGSEQRSNSGKVRQEDIENISEIFYLSTFFSKTTSEQWSLVPQDFQPVWVENSSAHCNIDNSIYFLSCMFVCSIKDMRYDSWDLKLETLGIVQDEIKPLLDDWMTKLYIDTIFEREDMSNASKIWLILSRLCKIVLSSEDWGKYPIKELSFEYFLNKYTYPYDDSV